MIRGALLTTIPTLTQEWMVEFRLKPKNFEHLGRTSIFNMTTGENKGTYGTRVPAIFFDPDDGLVVKSDVNNKSDYGREFQWIQWLGNGPRSGCPRSF